MKLFTRLRSIWGKFVGYSWCLECGLAWNVVDGQIINYTETSGMFPLCKQCFDKLNPSEIDKHIDWLVDSWKIERHNGLTPSEIKRGAMATMRNMKMSTLKRRD